MSTALVNACDAGREGELIFRYIARYAKAPTAGAASVAAVDDPGRHPRRVPGACAPTQEMQPLGRCRGMPFGVRLAGRHQRHPGDDGLQFQERRIPQDHGRPGANADAGHPGGTRRKDPQVRPARLLGSAWRPSTAAAGQLSSGRWFDESFGEADDEDPTKPTRRAHLGRRQALETIRGKLPGQAGRGHRGEQTQQLRFPRCCTTSPRCSARPTAASDSRAKNTLGLAQALYEKHKVLTYPRTDSRALPEDYLGTARSKCSIRCTIRPATATFAEQILRRGLGASEQAHLQQRQDQRSLRHHPHRRRAQGAVRAGAEAVRPGHQALPRRVLSRRRNSWSTTRITRVEGEAFQQRGQGAGEDRLARGVRRARSDYDDEARQSSRR
jgi:hypothetical protein